jgi:pSer/pThr/pTyr-binding forkhead associated (FHA) protein
LNFGRRGRANDIHLQGTNEITREHGYFILDNGNLFIVDNGSTHGTKINDGSNISPNAPVRVRPEDIISIAGNTFRISFQQNG